MPDPSLGVLLFIPYRHLEQRILRAVNEAGYPLTLAQARMPNASTTPARG